MLFLREYNKQCLSSWSILAIFSICCLYVCLLFSAQSWKCLTAIVWNIFHQNSERSSSFSLRNNRFTPNDFDLIWFVYINQIRMVYVCASMLLNECKITQFDTDGFQTDVQIGSSVTSALPIEHCTVCIQNTKKSSMNEWRSKPWRRLFLSFNFRHRIVHANESSKYTNTDAACFCGAVLCFRLFVPFVCYRAVLLISVL